MNINEISLTEIAKNAMKERDLFPEFSKDVLNEVESIEKNEKGIDFTNTKDLQDKFWISIDNDDSLDLDQLTYTETIDGKDVIFVAIADVDSLVKKGSFVDNHGKHNTTSVYTPSINFPMLPNKLSTNLTSLNPNVKRESIVVEMEVLKDGQCLTRGIYPALVVNHAKLAYPSVTAKLEGTGALPSPFNDNEKVIEQIQKHHLLSKKLILTREKEGTLNFADMEVKAVMKGGIPVDLIPKKRGAADLIIENFMIAANIAVTKFLTKNHLTTIRRVVKTPKRWDKIVEVARERGASLPLTPNNKALQVFLEESKINDPSRFPDLSLTIIKLIGRGEYMAILPDEKSPGHFDLALSHYAHTTAPNRRFPDLIMQRILKSHFLKTAPPYTNKELIDLAEHCTRKEDDATKVERRVQKSAAAIVLSTQIGKTFSGFVTGAADKGTWARISNPPIEGKIVKNSKGLDVGDKVRVRLISVDIENGFIDFERV